MRAWLACCVCVALPALGCRKGSAPGAGTGDAAPPVQAGPGASAANGKKPLEGRCENETSDTPFGSLYFFPTKDELFVTLDDTVERIPISVTKQDPEKTSFSYRWVEKEGSLATTSSATVAWVGTQKWSFDFETLKDSVCHPVTDELFYKKLPELGIKAGKYLDAKSNDMLTVVADSQKLHSEEKGKTNIWYYRVRSKSDDAGIKVFETNEAPSDSKPQVWGAWTISMLGEDLVIQFNKSFTRTYSPVK